MPHRLFITAFRRAAAGFCGVVALLVGLAGCAASDSGSLIIAGIGAPDDACIIQVPPEFFRSGGFLDLSARETYVLTPILRNNLDAEIDQVRLLSSPSFDVSLRGAEVEITDAAGLRFVGLFDDEFGDLPNPFTIPVSGFVEAGGSEQAISFDVIPAPYGRALSGVVREREQLVISVQIFGRTSGGNEVETPVFTFGIETINPAGGGSCPCAGGLANFRPGPSVRCAVGDEESEDACFPGQDSRQVLDPNCAECGGEGQFCFCSC